MAIRSVANFAQLVTALSAASDGDTILFTTNGTYTATQDLTISKSLTFECAGGVTPTLDMTASYELNVQGQSAGTFQSWIGPMTIKCGKSSADAAVIHAQSTSGNITLNLYQVDTVGLNGAARSRGSGVGGVATNVNHRVVINCYDCDASGVANQGFYASISGFTPASTSNHFHVVMNLYGCSGSNNGEEGSSGHEGTTINDYGAAYSTLGEYPFSPGVKCTQTGSNVTATVGSTIGGIDGQGITLLGEANVWTADNCTFTCVQPSASNWTANTAYTVGTFVKSVAVNGSRSPGLIFVCTTAGTSHATTEPTWNFGSGNTTSDGTVTWTSVNNHMIRVSAHSGTPAQVTMRNCTVTIARNSGLLNLAGPTTALFEDCTFTFTGDYRNLNTNAIIIGSAVLNTSVTFRRCVFDLSGCTSSTGTNRPPFVANTATSATTSIAFEGCVFIRPTNTFWNSTNTALIQFAANTYGSVKHCTFFGDGQTFLEPITVAAGASVTITGNIFSGWRRHIQVSGTTHTANMNVFFNPSGGAYINDSSGNVNPNGDAFGNVVGDPLFVTTTIPPDLHLQTDSPGELLDSSSSTVYQIESYTFTTSASGGGTVARSPSYGGAFSAPTDAGAYTNRSNGVTITATATPNTGSSFSSWGGDATGQTGTSAVLTLTANRTASATFAYASCFNQAVIDSGTHTTAAASTLVIQGGVGANVCMMDRLFLYSTTPLTVTVEKTSGTDLVVVTLPPNETIEVEGPFTSDPGGGIRLAYTSMIGTRLQGVAFMDFARKEIMRP